MLRQNPVPRLLHDDTFRRLCRARSSSCGIPISRFSPSGSSRSMPFAIPLPSAVSRNFWRNAARLSYCYAHGPRTPLAGLRRNDSDRGVFRRWIFQPGVFFHKVPVSGWTCTKRVPARSPPRFWFPKTVEYYSGSGLLFFCVWRSILKKRKNQEA